MYFLLQKFLPIKLEFLGEEGLYRALWQERAALGKICANLLHSSSISIDTSSTSSRHCDGTHLKVELRMFTARPGSSTASMTSVRSTSRTLKWSQAAKIRALRRAEAKRKLKVRMRAASERWLRVARRICIFGTWLLTAAEVAVAAVLLVSALLGLNWLGLNVCLCKYYCNGDWNTKFLSSETGWNGMEEGEERTTGLFCDASSSMFLHTRQRIFSLPRPSPLISPLFPTLS